MTIKELRNTTGLSQSKFAEYFNIPIKTLQKWETEERKPPEYVILMIENILATKKRINPKEIDFDKELKKEQYLTEEYLVGRHDGMWTMIGLTQRESSKGKNLQEILNEMFKEAEEYDRLR